MSQQFAAAPPRALRKRVMNALSEIWDGVCPFCASQIVVTLYRGDRRKQKVVPDLTLCMTCEEPLFEWPPELNLEPIPLYWLD